MDIIKTLSNLGVEFYCNAEGAKLTSFSSGGKVKYLLYPSGTTQLIKTLCALECEGVPYHIIGRGTNTLISDGGYDGALISLKRLNGIEIIGNKLFAEAGASLPTVANAAAKQGLSGLEFAEGIPASLGGAITTNAGAYGAEIGDKISEVYALSGYNAITMPNTDMVFHYRGSSVKDKKLIVLGAQFDLSHGSNEAILNDMKSYAEKRKMSQPQGKSAGSVFKRAYGISAGYYLDMLGFKGVREGGAMVSFVHANFILNIGGATTEDYLRLADRMAAAVFENYGIVLEREIEIIR